MLPGYLQGIEVLDNVVTLLSSTLEKCVDVINNCGVTSNFMYGLKIGPHIASYKVMSHMNCLKGRNILEDQHPGIVIIKVSVFHADRIEGGIGSLNVTIDVS